MKTFIAVAKFKSEATQEDIQKLIPAEQAQAKILQDAGSLGFIKVAMPQRTVFLEVFAESFEEATEVVHSLPLIVLWDVELFETTPPAGVQP